jgi:hypothetical protein
MYKVYKVESNFSLLMSQCFIVIYFQILTNLSHLISKLNKNNNNNNKI